MKPKDLRDEFALAALPEVIVGVNADIQNGYTLEVRGEPASEEQYIARVTYLIAEAMMAERKMKSPEYPECSGDPASCPENEGHGCCGRKA